MITAAYILATVAVVLIAAGLYFRNDRARHVPFMLVAFVADVVGVILVEVKLRAVEGLGEAAPLTLFHAIVAFIAVVGYVVQIVTGKSILKGEMKWWNLHRKVAVIFLVARALAYITMFMI